MFRTGLEDPSQTRAARADALGPIAVPAGSRTRSHRRLLIRLGMFAIWGPGLVVMLADTDAGSLITAAQSGARWRYAMVLPELALIPVLYVVQETALRLGVVTGQGHGALIRRHFGRGWARLSGFTLFISALGALITELAGVAGVGELFGLSRWLTIPICTLFLIVLALSGSYRRVERIALLLGLAELAFIPALLMSHPDAAAITRGALHIPFASGSFQLLLAANVGAVIMPWMVFFQQGAVVDKALQRQNLRSERSDTALGAVLTQLVMIAVVLALAGTVGRSHPGATLGTVGQISAALSPYLGATGARALFGAGMLGAALVAALVASLAGAWGVSEVFGWRHSLNERPSRANAPFYASYSLTHILGAVLVLASVDLVGLAVDVEVMNALLLPIVLGFPLALEARALPVEFRRRGWRRIGCWSACAVVMGFGLYMVPALLLG